MKRICMIVFFGIVMSCLQGILDHAGADQDGYRKISAPEVRIMMEKGNVVLVNVLSKIVYDIQHIPGSINIPINTMATADRLPKNKNTPLIFYCMGKV